MCKRYKMLALTLKVPCSQYSCMYNSINTKHIKQLLDFPTTSSKKKNLKITVHSKHVIFRYITSVKENVEEGTRLKFEGSLDRIEDLGKVKLSEHQHSTLM